MIIIVMHYYFLFVLFSTGALYSMEITKYLFTTDNLKDKKKATTTTALDSFNQEDRGYSNNVMNNNNMNKFSESDYKYLNINRGKSAALLLAVRL